MVSGSFVCGFEAVHQKYDATIRDSPRSPLTRCDLITNWAELNYLQSSNNSGNFSFTSEMTAVNALNPGNSGYSFASFMLGYGATGVNLNALTTNERGNGRS